MINKDQKKWIDSASYEDLLRRWRNAPVGDTIFQGETGKYYSDVMAKKRSKVGHNESVRASKNIGLSGN